MKMPKPEDRPMIQCSGGNRQNMPKTLDEHLHDLRVLEFIAKEERRRVAHHLRQIANIVQGENE